MIKPLLDRVVLQVADPEAVTPGGIILPPQAQEQPQLGQVLAVGPGRWRDDGTARIPVGIEVGDLVLFSRYGGTTFHLGDTDYTVVSGSEVLLVIEHAPDEQGQDA